MKRLLPLFILFIFCSGSFAQTSNNEELWLAPASKPRMFGLQNSKGDIAVKAQYDFLTEADGTGWIAYLGGKYGVISNTGNWIIKPNFQTIVQFVNGKAVAGKKLPRKISQVSQDYRYQAYTDNRYDSVYYYGVIDASGTWIIDAAYDFLRLSDDGSVQYTDQSGNFGFLNPDGTILLRAQYEYASRMTDGVAVIGQPLTENNYMNRGNRYHVQGGNYFIIDRTGKEITPNAYPLIREFSEGRAAFNKDGMWKRQRYYDDNARLIGGKWGFLDENGKEIVEAKYDYVYDYKNGKAKVRSGVRIFWIDKDGKECAAPEQVTKDFTIYCEPGFYGYLDVKGNWAIEPQYYSASEFSEGMAAVITLRASDMNCNNGVDNISDDSRSTYSKPLAYLLSLGSNYNDEDNVTEAAMILQDSLKIADSLNAIYSRRLYGYIDATGNMVLPAKYEVALPFHDGCAYVSYRGKWGVIDKKGNWIFAPVLEWPEELNSLNPNYYGYGRQSDNIYSSVTEDKEDAAAGEEYEYQNASGKSNAEMPSQPIYSFYEGVGIIMKYGKYGFIDTTGKIIASPVYDEALPFANGFAAVRHGNFWGFIDRTGKEIIPMQFKSATSFSKEGLACVGATPAGIEESLSTQYEADYNIYYGYIDKKGNWVIKPRYTKAAAFSEGLAAVSTDYGKLGYIDKSGKFIIPPKYDFAYPFKNGFASVKINMFEAVYIDKTGKVSKVYNQNKTPFDKSIPLLLKQGTNLRYGFVNEKGDVIIDYQFSKAGDFSRVK